MKEVSVPVRCSKKNELTIEASVNVNIIFDRGRFEVRLRTSACWSMRVSRESLFMGRSYQIVSDESAVRGLHLQAYKLFHSDEIRITPALTFLNDRFRCCFHFDLSIPIRDAFKGLKASHLTASLFDLAGKELPFPALLQLKLTAILGEERESLKSVRSLSENSFLERKL